MNPITTNTLKRVEPHNRFFIIPKPIQAHSSSSKWDHPSPATPPRPPTSPPASPSPWAGARARPCSSSTSAPPTGPPARRWTSPPALPAPRRRHPCAGCSPPRAALASPCSGRRSSIRRRRWPTRGCFTRRPRCLRCGRRGTRGAWKPVSRAWSRRAGRRLW